MAKQLSVIRNIILTIRKDAQDNTVKAWRAEGSVSDPAAANDMDKSGGPVAADFAYDANDTQAQIETKAEDALKAKAGIA